MVLTTSKEVEHWRTIVKRQKRAAARERTKEKGLYQSPGKKGGFGQLTYPLDIDLTWVSRCLQHVSFSFYESVWNIFFRQRKNAWNGEATKADCRSVWKTVKWWTQVFLWRATTQAELKCHKEKRSELAYLDESSCWSALQISFISNKFILQCWCFHSRKITLSHLNKSKIRIHVRVGR